MRRMYITGNWKMNKTPSEAGALARELADSLGTFDSVDMAVAPPFVALAAVAEALGLKS